MILELSDMAIEDLSDIKLFIKKDSIYYADVFVDKIFNSMDKLEDHPKIGRIVPEFKLDYIREIIFEDYRILYRIKPDSIYILTIIHGSRKLKKHLKKKDLKNI